MKVDVTIDDDLFDGWQIGLGIEMARAVRDALAEAGLEGEALRTTTGDVLFHVCALLDGASGVDVRGTALYPVILAMRGDGATDVVDGAARSVHAIGWSVGGTNLHEYAFGNVDWLFDEEGQAD